jgi:hypothetical protein
MRAWCVKKKCIKEKKRWRITGGTRYNLEVEEVKTGEGKPVSSVFKVEFF